MPPCPGTHAMAGTQTAEGRSSRPRRPGRQARVRRLRRRRYRAPLSRSRLLRGADLLRPPLPLRRELPLQIRNVRGELRLPHCEKSVALLDVLLPLLEPRLADLVPCEELRLPPVDRFFALDELVHALGEQLVALVHLLLLGVEPFER